MSRLLLFPICGVGATSEGASGQTAPPLASLTLDHPCPESHAGFGFATAVLQVEGVREQDVAVGAPGQGALFVFHGSHAGYDAFEQRHTYTSTGPARCLHARTVSVFTRLKNSSMGMPPSS